MTQTPVDLHRALGLTDDEFDDIRNVLGRAPNPLELALYGVMWSEHCSYKSSRIHLRRLPTTGERVLVGPGENAGVIDAGDGIAVAIRIESHNHPSAIEPYQGAATGVGGILRDIFTMGARPLAVMDPLFFGELTDARQRWLFEGVVAGISGYGNSVGVPTVGGELTFDPCYAGNPLVNVLCLGALPVDRLVLGAATGVGNLAVLLGSSTGRDGIGGVSVLASAGFGGDEDADDGAKRPSVQVGDPYEEKRLIEACLELLDRHLVVGIQDLGGAGLACATSETAARGDVGMDVDVTAVPRRETGMEPFEVMTSESQERMLAIIEPGHLEALNEVCQRWEVRASVVGRVVAPDVGPDGVAVGRLRVRDGFDGPVLADVPAASLAHDAPLYDRPMRAPERTTADEVEPTTEGAESDAAEDLLAMLVDPLWVHRQYDTQLFLNTVVGPGRDATLLRLAGPGLPNSERGIGITTDSNPRWCSIDARLGVSWTLLESLANLACVGAWPIAVVNCLNFGNPEDPEVMWAFSECVDGLAESCRQLGLPVVGGNVSLYNESKGQSIDPTPVLGVLGLVERLVSPPPNWELKSGDAIMLVGDRIAPGLIPHPLAGSRWATQRGLRGGSLPPIDFHSFSRSHKFATFEIEKVVAGYDSDVKAIHDVSSGGIAVALGEWAARGIGIVIDEQIGMAEMFSEIPGRFLFVTTSPDAFTERSLRASVPVVQLGYVGGDYLQIPPFLSVDAQQVRTRFAEAINVALNHVD